ncbi:MAG: winged helix-turn-helix domain-containing protein [Paracoccaceae bacterium]
MPLKINNRIARRLWLNTQGLATPPTGPLDVLSIIRQLGFVQLDTIQVIARAHHHIIWSRNQHYREPMLDKLMKPDRRIFEHFTHDASVIPMEFYPMWRRQFRRKQQQQDRSNWNVTMLDLAGRNQIKERIRIEGALSTHAFDTQIAGPKQMWTRPPHKLALDYMWYSGELATCYRKNFTKFYNLAERIFPAELSSVDHSDEAQIDWLCNAAIERLGVATLGEIQKFWDAVSLPEVKDWAERIAGKLVRVEMQAADGSWNSAWANENIEDKLTRLQTSTTRMRILNPFDPAIRDRNRLKRLFGFDYRVEMFVPQADRLWGYYVYPILEGEKFVGRIEAKADRAKDLLCVQNFWPSAKVKWTRQRQAKLEAEIDRLAKLASVQNVVWNCQV